MLIYLFIFAELEICFFLLWQLKVQTPQVPSVVTFSEKENKSTKQHADWLVEHLSGTIFFSVKALIANIPVFLTSVFSFWFSAILLLWYWYILNKMLSFNKMVFFDQRPFHDGLSLFVKQIYILIMFSLPNSHLLMTLVLVNLYMGTI